MPFKRLLITWKYGIVMFFCVFLVGVGGGGGVSTQVGGS